MFKEVIIYSLFSCLEPEVLEHCHALEKWKHEARHGQKEVNCLTGFEMVRESDGGFTFKEREVCINEKTDKKS
jgi:hypothetical protein